MKFFVNQPENPCTVPKLELLLVALARARRELTQQGKEGLIEAGDPKPLLVLLNIGSPIPLDGILDLDSVYPPLEELRNLLATVFI